MTSAFSLDPTVILPSFLVCRPSAAVASASSWTAVELFFNDRLFPSRLADHPSTFATYVLLVFRLFLRPQLPTLPGKAHGRCDTIQSAIEETREHSLLNSRHIILSHPRFATRACHAYDSKLELSIGAHSIPRQLHEAHLSLIDDGRAILRFARLFASHFLTKLYPRRQRRSKPSHERHGGNGASRRHVRPGPV